MDLVGMLTKSVKAAGLHMGLYHSLFEWFKFVFSIIILISSSPIFNQDQQNNLTTNTYVTEILMPELYDIVNSYEPDLVANFLHEMMNLDLG